MNRNQISILHAKGKTVGEVIFSRSDDEILIALGEDEFAIIKAARRYDEDAEIEHDVSDTAFCRISFQDADLPKVFDANTIAEFKEEDAREYEKQRKRMEEYDRKKFEELKAKFGQ